MHHDQRLPDSEKRRVIYYTQTNGEVVDIPRSTVTVDETFPYIRRGWLWRIASFVVYRVLLMPVAYWHSQLRFHMRIQNRAALRPYRRQGIIMYGNHTLMFGDTYIPTLAAFPQKCYVMAHADNISVRGLKNILLMGGALPVPTTLRGMPQFRAAVRQRLSEGALIQIYPEAHIWPYCTEIRPFDTSAFHDPVETGCPVFCATTTFYQRRFRRTPGVTVTIDGPFFPDPNAAPRAQVQALRDQVYETMRKRAAQGRYSPVIYLQRTENDD